MTLREGVLIAIPYWGVAAELLDDAVRRALAQTVEATVLVLGDGQRPPTTVRDDRLVVRSLRENRGVAFTQQAMLLGSPLRWYAPHGADDWAEPYHLARLLALRSRAAGSGAVWYHGPAGTEVLRSSRTWIEFGCFDAELLRSVGGWGGHERAGQDSVLISVLLGTTRVALTRAPSYHKRWRPDSLTHDPETRGGSPFRTGIRERNRALLRRLEQIGWHRRRAIRAVREELLDAPTRLALDRAAAAVERALR